jgi:hypothetical protein
MPGHTPKTLAALLQRLIDEQLHTRADIAAMRQQLDRIEGTMPDRIEVAKDAEIKAVGRLLARVVLSP